MGSNIIELAKLGHERAAELKASCGAVDVRSLAQLISDLATQLEVQFVRSTNMAVQLANAESKCRELAAECAGMKQLASEAYDEMVSHHDTDGLYSLDADGEQMDALIRLCDAQATIYDTLVMCETPETDAFLAEVRAQGVEMYADNLDRGADDAERDGFDDAVKFLRSEASGVRLFAAQLRMERG
ncbi:hypothetical protein DCN17_09525 [Salmonella enterica]|nr:hypothetical protein [Salmonella enterica]